MKSVYGLAVILNSQRHRIGVKSNQFYIYVVIFFTVPYGLIETSSAPIDFGKNYRAIFT